MKNNVIYFQQYLSKEWNKEKIETHIINTLSNLCPIFSFVVKSNPDSYEVRYGLSEIDEFNTIDCESTVRKIIKAIFDDTACNKYIIAHGQPPIDLMIKIYEPLIQHLAANQHRRWQRLELEDLCQICRMTLIILYNKGYYIHKRLLEKSFNNAVLQEIRTLKIDVDIVSMETSTEGEDMEKLTLKDTIPDTEAEIARENEDDIYISKKIFEEVKEILIERIGLRQFEQLYRDYSKQHTSTTSRRKMVTLKYQFKQEGLTRQKFNNKYGR